MPIYEYQCQCGTEFQKLMKLKEKSPPCPDCKSTNPKKKISVGSFVLKGSGWYKDHYGLRKARKQS